MNKIERFVYKRLRNAPMLKTIVRNGYQAFFDIIPTPSFDSFYRIKNRPGFFFGFHDHTPFSYDNSKLLANRYLIPLRMPQPKDQLEIGYFDGPEYTKSKSIHIRFLIAESLGSQMRR